MIVHFTTEATHSDSRSQSPDLKDAVSKGGLAPRRLGASPRFETAGKKTGCPDQDSNPGLLVRTEA